MAGSIYLYVPIVNDLYSRADLEDELENRFADVMEQSGGGGGRDGYNLDFELTDDVDPFLVADRLLIVLESMALPNGTRFDVFPGEWQPGDRWRSVSVHGEDRYRNDDPNARDR